VILWTSYDSTYFAKKEAKKIAEWRKTEFISIWQWKEQQASEYVVVFHDSFLKAPFCIEAIATLPSKIMKLTLDQVFSLLNIALILNRLFLDYLFKRSALFSLFILNEQGEEEITQLSRVSQTIECMIFSCTNLRLGSCL
jgi:hypothetical protein